MPRALFAEDKEHDGSKPSFLFAEKEQSDGSKASSLLEKYQKNLIN